MGNFNFKSLFKGKQTMLKLILGEAYGKGGIQKYNKNMIEILLHENLESCVLSLNDEVEFKKENLIFKGFKKNKIKFFIFSIFYSIKSKKIIIGHLNFLPIVFFIKILNPFAKIFLILYGIEAWRKLNFLEKIFSKFINSWISVSNFTKEKFLEFNPYLKKKDFYILPTYVKMDKEIDNREKLPEGKIILSVSRLAKSEKYKGIEKVIKVMPYLLREVPDVYYVIVGDGDDRKNLEKIAENLNVKERVIFTGFLPEEKLNFYYRNCDLFILPSKGEGFGIVLLEALSFGKPVIAGNKDGSKEALLNGELGILIDPENLDEIKYKIIKVLKREVDKKFFDENYLKKKVEENFGFVRFKERFEGILK